MSYCRFSSDNFGSDVYCYESQDGFVIHVAACRCESDTPIPTVAGFEEWGVSVSFDDVVRQMGERDAWLDSARRVPIGLPFDGESFCIADAADAAEWLMGLVAHGYQVPQRAIDALWEEAKDEELLDDPDITLILGEAESDAETVDAA